MNDIDFKDIENVIDNAITFREDDEIQNMIPKTANTESVSELSKGTEPEGNRMDKVPLKCPFNLRN